MHDINFYTHVCNVYAGDICAHAPRFLMDHSIVKSRKNMVRVLVYPDHAKTKCPLCNIDEPQPTFAGTLLYT